MSQSLELAGGQRALLVAVEGEAATLETPMASPPGSILELQVLGAPARFKVRRCQRLVEGEAVRFRIEGRWQSLSRAQLDSLLR
jgi:hypothetical protein